MESAVTEIKDKMVNLIRGVFMIAGGLVMALIVIAIVAYFVVLICATLFKYLIIIFI